MQSREVVPKAVNHEDLVLLSAATVMLGDRKVAHTAAEQNWYLFYRIPTRL